MVSFYGRSSVHRVLHIQPVASHRNLHPKAFISVLLAIALPVNLNVPQDNETPPGGHAAPQELSSAARTRQSLPRRRASGFVSHAVSALFVVFLILPWGNATFLLAIVTVFAWIAWVAVRLATHHS